MPRAAEYLLDIEALDADGDPVTVRLATCPYWTRNSDTPASVEYVEAIADPGDFEVNLFGENETMGTSSTGTGKIVVVNTTKEFDVWMDYVLDGRPFTLRRIDDPGLPFSAAQIVQVGFIESLDTTNATDHFDLVIHDRMKELQRPLLTARYAGTTTSGDDPDLTEGNDDLKGQIKPRIFGSVFNIEPKPVNVYNRMFQVSVASVTSIVAYDGRVPLVSAGNFASAGTLKTNLTTGTAIKTAQYGTVLNAGLLGVRNSSDMPLTCDVVEGASSKPGAVCKRILVAYGMVAGVDFDGASFDALDVAAPYDVGIMVDDDSTCLDVLGRVLKSVGAWLTTDALGVFSVGRFMGPGTPVKTFGTDDDDVLGDLEILGNPDFDAVPVWRVVLTWGLIGLVQDSSQVKAGCVDEATKAFVAVQSRTVTAADSSVLAEHELAAELSDDRVQTLLTHQADAQAVADHLLALYSVPRRAVRWTIRREDLTFGWDTIRLELSRLLTGNDMVVIGMRERRKDQQVDLIVWG